MSAFELIYRVQFTLSPHSINTNETATLRVFLVAIQYSVTEHFCFVLFFCVHCFVLFFVLLLLLLFYCFTPSFMTAMQITRIFKHPSLARNYFLFVPFSRPCQKQNIQYVQASLFCHAIPPRTGQKSSPL